MWSKVNLTSSKNRLELPDTSALYVEDDDRRPEPREILRHDATNVSPFLDVLTCEERLVIAGVFGFEGRSRLNKGKHDDIRRPPVSPKEVSHKLGINFGDARRIYRTAIWKMREAAERWVAIK